MKKRTYNIDKNYKSASIRFNLKSKEEKELFNALSSMSSKERTEFILGLWKTTTIENKQKMSIYEERLFDLVEKSITGGRAINDNRMQAGLPPLKENNENKYIPVPSKNKEPSDNESLKGSSVNYEGLILNKTKNKVNFDDLLDNMTDEGIKE